MYVNSVIFLCKSSFFFFALLYQVYNLWKIKICFTFFMVFIVCFLLSPSHTLLHHPPCYTYLINANFFIYFCTKYLCYTQTIFKCSSGISKTQQALENSNNSDMNKFSAKKLSKEVNLSPEREKDNQRQY